MFKNLFGGAAPVSSDTITPAQLLDGLAQDYAAQFKQLADIAAALDADICRLKQCYELKITQAASDAVGARDALERGVSNNPQLFVDKRTRESHGVKYGYQACRASVVVNDIATTLAAIKQQLPQQAQWLIVTKETVSLSAAAKLTDDQIALIGVTRNPAQDAVVAKLADADADKAVARAIEMFVS